MAVQTTVLQCSSSHQETNEWLGCKLGGEGKRGAVGGQGRCNGFPKRKLWIFCFINSGIQNLKNENFIALYSEIRITCLDHRQLPSSHRPAPAPPPPATLPPTYTSNIHLFLGVYCCTAILLAALPYCYTATLLYYHTAILPYCCTAILLYCHTALLPYCCTAILPTSRTMPYSNGHTTLNQL